MIKSIVTYDNHDLVKVVHFDVPDLEFDLEKAIIKATKKYCETKEGIKIGKANNGFNLKNFIEHTPNEICQSYGFQKIQSLDASIFMDCLDKIVSKEEVDRLDYEMEKLREQEIRRVTISFTNKWNCIDNNELLSVISDEQMKKNIRRWAEHYVDNGHKYETVYFDRKVKELKRIIEI